MGKISRLTLLTLLRIYRVPVFTLLAVHSPVRCVVCACNSQISFITRCVICVASHELKRKTCYKFYHPPIGLNTHLTPHNVVLIQFFLTKNRP